MISNQAYGQVPKEIIHGGASLGGNVPRELSILERSSGVVSSLQSLHAKLSDFRDKIEGAGEAKGDLAHNAPYGLTPQITESESILRACHSLMDDIAGKF